MGSIKSERLEIGEGFKPNKWKFLPDPMTIPKDGKMKEYKYFEGNKKLLEIAEKINYIHEKIVRGIIGIANQWNRELDRIDHLNKVYGSSTEEIETLAVAQIAEVYGILFLGVRILSNIEIHEEKFALKSGAYCQSYAIEIVKAIK